MRNQKFKLILILLLGAGLMSLQAQTTETFTDSRDGKTYKTVKIGDQIWMAENLNYKSDSGSWCYDDNPENCEKYGRFYDWEAAKKACPEDWHLPSKNEFDLLLSNFGGEDSRAYTELKSGGGSGFSALFGGWSTKDRNCFHIGMYGRFCSSTSVDEDNIWKLGISSLYNGAGMNAYSKYHGTSVRCIKDY